MQKKERIVGAGRKTKTKKWNVYEIDVSQHKEFYFFGDYALSRYDGWSKKDSTAQTPSNVFGQAIDSPKVFQIVGEDLSLKWYG